MGLTLPFAHLLLLLGAGAINKLDATMETIVFFFMSISSLFVINTPIILCKRF